MSIKVFLSGDHKACDDVFAEFENSVVRGEKERSKELFESLKRGFEEHFLMEEEVLFPEFESKSGMSCGPTQVMRMEHEQMRFNLGMIGKALDGGDKSKTLGMCESFMILTQQHNSKEEQILYTMCDQVLAQEGTEIVEKMKAKKGA